MGSVGPVEILVVFLAALLLFGAKKLPEIARGLGTGIREFKGAMREISSEMRVDDYPRHTTSPRPHATVASPAVSPISQAYGASVPDPAHLAPVQEAPESQQIQ